MSVSAINGNNAAITGTQLTGISSAGSGQDTDGDNDGSRGSRVGGGKFASAISQVLSQLGVSTGSSATGASGAADTSDSSATQDPQQALTAFMQNLYAALQAQASPQTPASDSTAAGSDGSSAVASVSRHHHHHGAGMSKLESGLQNIAQQLSASSSSGTSGSALDNLQQSFSSLLTADGVSGNGTTLGSFLQALSQNLQSAPATGNVVSTRV